MSEIRRRSFHRIMVVCGLVGPIFYAVVLLVLGSLWPGYNHITQLMSELGSVGAPHAPLMNILGFQLLGLMLVAFAFALHEGAKPGNKIGPALVALSGAGLFLSGVFPCDPGCIDETLTGKIHSKAAMIAALSMPFATLAVAPRLEGKHQTYSFFASIAAGVISMLYQLPEFKHWEGVLQRLAFGVSMSWVELISWSLLRQSYMSTRKN